LMGYPTCGSSRGIALSLVIAVAISARLQRVISDPILRLSGAARRIAVAEEVRDNGIGIESRYHERVFGLFDQLDQRVDGSGIGLALVKRIVEVHGGRVWVESEGTGHGATFCFTVAPRSISA